MEPTTLTPTPRPMLGLALTDIDVEGEVLFEGTFIMAIAHDSPIQEGDQVLILEFVEEGMAIVEAFLEPELEKEIVI